MLPCYFVFNAWRNRFVATWPLTFTIFRKLYIQKIWDYESFNEFLISWLVFTPNFNYPEQRSGKCFSQNSWNSNVFPCNASNFLPVLYLAKYDISCAWWIISQHLNGKELLRSKLFYWNFSSESVILKRICFVLPSNPWPVELYNRDLNHVNHWIA